MSGCQRALSRAVASKAEMYGFPLIVWSSGGLQVHRFGMPGIEGVLSFVGGALVAMAIIVAISCNGFRNALPKRDPSVRGYGGVHFISVMGSVVIGWAVTLPVQGMMAFFLASLVTVFAFELLVALELHLAVDRKAGLSAEVCDAGEIACAETAAVDAVAPAQSPDVTSPGCAAPS